MTKESRSEAPSLNISPSDEFAYKVAICAWKDGLSPNGIARALDLESTPANLMKVKRALRRAQQQFLRIVPPLNEQLQDKLRNRFNNTGRNIKFHVVVDDWETQKGVPIDSGLVCLKAADVASEIIKDTVRAKYSQTQAASSSQLSNPSKEASADAAPAKEDPGADKQPPVVICNAGGRTISDTVKAMLQNPPVLDEWDETESKLRELLLFVAGNCAYQTTNFQRSANFLCVTMAEIYGAHHEAFPYAPDEDFLARHRQLVENSALFICGAGNRNSGLMTRHLRDKNIPIPDEAVGDIAFNLLDKDGRRVDLRSNAARTYLKQLNPILDLETIIHLAAKSRVLLVLDSEKPAEKTAIAIAILRREYPTDVVLGTRLAKAILQEP